MNARTHTQSHGHSNKPPSSRGQHVAAHIAVVPGHLLGRAGFGGMAVATHAHLLLRRLHLRVLDGGVDAAHTHRPRAVGRGKLVHGFGERSTGALVGGGGEIQEDNDVRVEDLEDLIALDGQHSRHGHGLPRILRPVADGFCSLAGEKEELCKTKGAQNRTR